MRILFILLLLISPTLAKKNILFLAGKPSHANGEHEFRAGCMLLAKALNESGLDIEAKVHYYGWPEDESIFDGVDACVIYADAGGRFGEKYAVLDKKVKAGMGIMFMHYGVHPSKEVGKKYFTPWIGGYMETGWSVNPHWIADITPKANHPVGNGVKPGFKSFDEYYWNMRFPTKEECDCCHALATSVPTPEKIVRYINLWNEHGERTMGTEQALMWCRAPMTGGRGVGFVGGHYHRNWAIKDFRTLVLNAIVWLARVDVPKDGVPSKAITQEQLNENLDRPVKGKPVILPTDALLKYRPMKMPDLKKRKQRKEQRKKGATKKKSAWKSEHPARKVSLDYFKLPADLEVSVWATSPHLYNPTNMDIDHKGRIWVAEGVNYRRNKGRRPGGDRIAVLEDTNGDGTCDKSHTFVQEKGLIAPLGVAVFDNVIYVSQPPELLVYTDVNRDLKFDPAIDKREVLLTGFNARNHDHSLHSVTAGPDGKFYFNNGNCGAVFKDRSGKNFYMGGPYKGGGGEFLIDHLSVSGKRSDDGHIWTSGFTVRMDPDGTNCEIVGHGYRNSYEQSLDSYGNTFQNDNDDPPACRVSYILEYGCAGYFTRDAKQGYRSVKRPGQDHGRAHWRQDDPGTMDAGHIYGGGSPTGVTMYENGALPEKYNGAFFSCEPGKNTIFHYQPEPKGANFKLEQKNLVTTNPDKKYAGSDFVGGGADQNDSKILFRPSDICVGPDGALYITDWYDARVGGHSDRDVSCSGTIYRIAPKGFKPAIPKFDLKTIKGAITALKSPAVNTRYLGFKALKKHGEKALPAVGNILNETNEHVAARAIWLLPHLGKKGKAECVKLLKVGHPHIRLTAYRALRRANIDILPYAKQLAKDPDPGVRRDIALSLRDLPAEKTKDIFAALAPQVDHTDKNAVEAIGLGAANQENDIWLAIKTAMKPGQPHEWSEQFAKLTWRLWPSAAVTDLKARAIHPSLTPEARKFAVESLAFISHKSSADAMLALADNPITKADATFWLLRNGLGEWKAMNLMAELKKRGIYDPSNITATPITVPAPKKPKFSVADVLKLKGNADKGKSTMMRCVMCHQVGKTGPAYGPHLQGWGIAQTPDVIARAIIEPSADIAHGYGGSVVQLKKGGEIHGLLISNGDPLVIKSTGGVTQMIPRKLIKGRARSLKRSLMLSADQLGLTAQDVADLVEYMKLWK
ncbi:MAG: PVC-type heme-binding CxxCH protein [Akkermansiaceae bacterium]